MGELRAPDGAVRAHEPTDARQHLDMPVLPETEIVRADPAFSGDGRGFGEDERGTADRELAEMNEMPVVGESVGTRVLAHRRHADAVAQRDPRSARGLKSVMRKATEALHPGADFTHGRLRHRFLTCPAKYRSDSLARNPFTHPLRMCFSCSTPVFHASFAAH